MNSPLSYKASNAIAHWVNTYGLDNFLREVNLSRSTYYRIMGFRTISNKSLKKISDKFGNPEDYIADTHISKVRAIDIFHDKYFAYILAEDDAQENGENIIIIDNAMLTINKSKGVVDLTLLLDSISSKKQTGDVFVDRNYISFSLFDSKNHFFYMFTNPRIEMPDKYLGGLGICLGPFNSNREISVRKIILSTRPFNLKKGENDYIYLYKQLRLHDSKRDFGIFTLCTKKENTIFKEIKRKDVEARKKKKPK